MLSDRTSKALTGISKATLKSGVRVKHLFRIMTQSNDLWMMAYANIHANQGATTSGSDGTSLDGMSLDRIKNLMWSLKNESYEPKATRRVYIPKANGKMRPLGIPSGDDKLVQEVARILLDQIYEPVFSVHSHGFRPQRSCHTALQDIKTKWKGTKWIVDMDIKSFFDNIDHQILTQCLNKKIDDPKFIKLIQKFLKAGFIDDWKFHGTFSGTPQGGIVSPILANVVLHELDQFLEHKQQVFNKGKSRKESPRYRSFSKKIESERLKIDKWRKIGVFDFMIEEARSRIKSLDQQRSQLPCFETHDENYRRLQFIRYADDFAVGLAASRADAEVIFREVREFLKQKLGLEIAEEKSGIRSIKEGFRFLGHHLSADIQNERVRKIAKNQRNKSGRKVYLKIRTLKSDIFIQVPKEKVWAFCQKKGYLLNRKPTARNRLRNLSDYEIISTYNAEMRGFANFYAMAPKRHLRIMQYAGLLSLFKTLASKHQTTSLRMRGKLKVQSDHILSFKMKGKIKRLKVFKLKDRSKIPLHVDIEQTTALFGNVRTEIVERMNMNQCDYCGITSGSFEVHHVRKLKDLMNKKHKLPWEQRMIARRRKTMILCNECHVSLHAGTLQGWKRDFYKEGEPDALKGASPVRKGVHAPTG